MHPCWSARALSAVHIVGRHALRACIQPCPAGAAHTEADAGAAQHAHSVRAPCSAPFGWRAGHMPGMPCAWHLSLWWWGQCLRRAACTTASSKHLQGEVRLGHVASQTGWQTAVNWPSATIHGWVEGDEEQLMRRPACLQPAVQVMIRRPPSTAPYIHSCSDFH